MNPITHTKENKWQQRTPRKKVLVTCKISISDTFAVTVLPYWASATRTAWCSWTSRASLKTLAMLSWFSFLLRRTHMIVTIEDVRVDWEVTKSCTMIDYLSRQDGDIMPALEEMMVFHYTAGYSESLNQTKRVISWYS